MLYCNILVPCIIFKLEWALYFILNLQQNVLFDGLPYNVPVCMMLVGYIGCPVLLTWVQWWCLGHVVHCPPSPVTCLLCTHHSNMVLHTNIKYLQLTTYNKTFKGCFMENNHFPSQGLGMFKIIMYIYKVIELYVWVVSTSCM